MERVTKHQILSDREIRYRSLRLRLRTRGSVGDRTGEGVEPASAPVPSKHVDIFGLGSLKSSQTAVNAIDASMKRNEVGSERWHGNFLDNLVVVNPELHVYCLTEQSLNRYQTKVPKHALTREILGQIIISLGGPTRIWGSPPR